MHFSFAFVTALLSATAGAGAGASSSLRGGGGVVIDADRKLSGGITMVEVLNPSGTLETGLLDTKDISNYYGYVSSSSPFADDVIPPGKYACGVRVRTETGDVDSPMTGLDLKYCLVGDWEVSQEELTGGTGTAISTGWQMCATDTYLIGGEEKAVLQGSKISAVTALLMTCRDVDGGSENYVAGWWSETLGGTLYHADGNRAVLEFSDGKLIQNYYAYLDENNRYIGLRFFADVPTQYKPIGESCDDSNQCASGNCDEVRFSYAEMKLETLFLPVSLDSPH